VRYDRRMPADRITRLRIEGMRCVDKVDIEIGAFTVLIGENGAGKSTIVEAVELLRKAATESKFIDKLYQPHGGTRMLRAGERHLRIGVRIDGDGPPLDYEFLVVHDGSFLYVSTERLAGPQDREFLIRIGPEVSKIDRSDRSTPLETRFDSSETMLSQARSFSSVREATRMQNALATIEVHVPLDLRSTWAIPQAGVTARSSNVVRPADRLDPGGTNLANVYAKLKNQTNWRETLGRLRLVLGDLDDVLIQPDPSGGSIGLEVRWRNSVEVPLSGLSDGQVSLLALIAIQQLQRKTPPSLVVIDEPEAHLHPGVTRRIAAGLAEASEDWPVMVATQSDAFLDAVSDRPDSLLHCRLDAERRTELARLDRERVQEWLDNFRGIGELRREGMEDLAFPPVQ
jgi:predicted ATPase